MTWMKGQSGNPGGRVPRTESPTTCLRSILRERDPTTGKTNGEAVAVKLLELALSGNVEALKYAFDRVDGRPIEPNEVRGKIMIKLRWDNADDD